MEHFINESWIKSSTIQTQVLKRKVAFRNPTDDTTAELCMVDEHADEKIIKVLHDRKVSVYDFCLVFHVYMSLDFKAKGRLHGS